MDLILLDTSIVSILHPQKRESTLRSLYLNDISGRLPVISFQTAAEIYYWAESRNWSQANKENLNLFLNGFITIPNSTQLSKLWAKIMDRSRIQGRKLDSGDCWIAATAVLLDIPLITHDADFIDLNVEGLKVISHL